MSMFANARGVLWSWLCSGFSAWFANTLVCATGADVALKLSTTR